MWCDGVWASQRFGETGKDWGVCHGLSVLKWCTGSATAVLKALKVAWLQEISPFFYPEEAGRISVFECHWKCHKDSLSRVQKHFNHRCLVEVSS